MEIAYAFFAEAVQLTSDGRVNILGADKTKLTYPDPPPWTVSAISLLVCVHLEREECGRLYHLTADLIAPDGKKLDPHIETSFVAPVPEDPELKCKMTALLQLSGLALPAPGIYQMQVRAEDRERGTLAEKHIRLRVAGPPAPQDTAST
jgi:hypothetical protein